MGIHDISKWVIGRWNAYHRDVVVIRDIGTRGCMNKLLLTMVCGLVIRCAGQSNFGQDHELIDKGGL